MAMDDTKRHVFESERQFLEFAHSYVSEAFPNAERRGCPSRDAISAFAEEPVRFDRGSISSHLTACSPCFNEYIAQLQRVRIRSRKARLFRRIELWGAIAFAGLLLIFLVVGRYYTRANKIRVSESQVKPPQAPTVPPIAQYIPLTIDLENASPVRGTGKSNSALPPQTIPSSPYLDLTLELPIGSRDQKYMAELRSDGAVLWSQSAHSRFESRQLLLRMYVDFSRIPPGTYDLVVVGNAFHVALPVLIKSSTAYKP